MHKIGMFEILSRCFLQSFHFQEEKTRHFILPLESGAILFYGEKCHNTPANYKKLSKVMREFTPEFHKLSIDVSRILLAMWVSFNDRIFLFR